MSLRAILYAYVLGGLTFIPLVILGVCFYAVYTSVPVGDPNVDKFAKGRLEQRAQNAEADDEPADDVSPAAAPPQLEVNDRPRTRKGWLTVRRTFEEIAPDASYVGLVRGFLDARSKDPKRSRPKDMWYVVLKGKVLYLYEDENMTECEAAIELGSHDVVVYPEGLLDGELFAKRNAICLKPKLPQPDDEMPSVTKEMVSTPDFVGKVVDKDASPRQKQRQEQRAQEMEKKHEESRQEAFEPSTPWFIFVRSNVEMEDWYLALIHASDNPPNRPTLSPLEAVFRPADMLHLVETLDEQPDVIPMRWLNALIGRIFFSYYRTKTLEAYIIGRLMRKLSKIKRPSFLTDVSVREVSVGNNAPTLSKPMLKELTKEGDASLEVHLQYKGEIRITVDATATINLGQRFKTYTVKLVLAAVLRELEGNLLIKVKRPPSSRIWYAFTQTPRMVLNVEPVVSDRQITWSMILSTIEARLKEVIQESVVLPNMDDISFFESLSYNHRGGIWADASREEHKPSELLRTPSEAPDEERLPASAPPSDTSTPLAGDLEPVALHRTRSAPGDALSNPLPDMEALGVPRATTVSGLSATANSAAARRRTWFSGAPSEEAEASTSGKKSASEAFERGRSLGTENVLMRRSSSTPNTPPQGTESDSQTPRPRNDDGEGSSHLQPIPIRRSSSQHSHESSSQSRGSSPSSSLENTSSSGPSESFFATFRAKSPATSEKTLPISPTTTFFQTLKTRDKQAISNSAKEAMRKWGVNWGLKKGDLKADEGADAEQQKRETEAREARPRPHYAEVRAAVEQRKTNQAEGGLAPAFEPYEAAAVPRRYQGKERAPSVSSLGSASGYSVGNGNGVSPSTSPRPGGATLDIQDSSGSGSSALPPPPPPAMRGRTSSHVSQAGSEGAGAAPPPPTVTLPPDEDEHPAAPIHTQPPAPKTMTIPGIHASHRGEVMSMGYAPPPPPPSEQKKTPAIQSVYRLWKTPSAGGPTQGLAPLTAQPETQVGFNGRDQDASASTSTPDGVSVTVSPPEAQEAEAEQAPTEPPISAPVAPAIPARPVPPPLPPRSHSTNAVQLASEPPRHPPGVDRSSPPASAALQSIVSKDNSIRASLELQQPQQPPPTPPRPQPATSTNASGERTPSLPTTPVIPSDAAGDGMAAIARKPPALPPRRVQPPAA